MSISATSNLCEKVFAAPVGSIDFNTLRIAAETCPPLIAKPGKLTMGKFKVPSLKLAGITAAAQQDTARLAPTTARFKEIKMPMTARRSIRAKLSVPKNSKKSKATTKPLKDPK